jgi:ribosomal protein S18 acetylase RimI-like enzyme
VRYDCGVIPDDSVLDNVTWHALTTVQAGFADVLGAARRYEPLVSVFCAIDAGADDDWADLAALVGAEGVAILFRGDVPERPEGWTTVVAGVGHQMVLHDLAPVPLPDSRPLGPDDVDQMTALVELAQPGPFRPRTIELGDYHGVFDDDRLVAMAGERQKVPGFTEVSAVCVHPDARRRGLGAAITARVAQGILDRGEVPFLHHSEDNHDARRVYEALGFRFRREVGLVIAQPPSAG